MTLKNNIFLLNRRQFVVAALCQSLFSVLPSTKIAASNFDFVRKMLRSASPNLAIANVVGLRVLETLPWLAEDAEKHLKRLSQNVECTMGGVARDRSVYRKSIQAKINQDLLADNIVIVDGWIMARSEAVFCAVVAHFNLVKI